MGVILVALFLVVVVLVVLAAFHDSWDARERRDAERRNRP